MEQGGLFAQGAARTFGLGGKAKVGDLEVVFSALSRGVWVGSIFDFEVGVEDFEHVSSVPCIQAREDV